jgi:hypothetical protein
MTKDIAAVPPTALLSWYFVQIQRLLKLQLDIHKHGECRIDRWYGYGGKYTSYRESSSIHLSGNFPNKDTPGLELELSRVTDRAPIYSPALLPIPL